jgi:hypothetical protein
MKEEFTRKERDREKLAAISTLALVGFLVVCVIYAIISNLF